MNFNKITKIKYDSATRKYLYTLIPEACHLPRASGISLDMTPTNSLVSNADFNTGFCVIIEDGISAFLNIVSRQSKLFLNEIICFNKCLSNVRVMQLLNVSLLLAGLLRPIFF